MLDPVFSPVAPRVFAPSTGDVIPLVDVIADWLEGNQNRRVLVEGDQVLDALRHLAAAFADHVKSGKLHFEESSPCMPSNVIVSISTKKLPGPFDASLRLANWCHDDFIEYLLAKHPDQCASVVNRLQGANLQFANGSPSVWRLILDRLAECPDPLDIEETVLDQMDMLIASSETGHQVAIGCSGIQAMPRRKCSTTRFRCR